VVSWLSAALGTTAMIEHPRDDPYADVALIFAGFICEGCPNDLLDIPTRPYTPVSGWEEEIGRYARDAGWYVEVLSANDWLVLCPACRAAGRKSRIRRG
jgi:hypothetical protein